MPYLESLYIAGNGLAGPLPEVDMISPSLRELAVSYNSLTGTIPEIIQGHGWQFYDVSYNHLTGTLSNNVNTTWANGESISNNSSSSGITYKANVNLLSGSIPNDLINYANIAILNGNLFACGFPPEDDLLPHNDPNATSYTCGSNDVNFALLAWSVALFLIVALMFIVVLMDRAKVSAAMRILQNAQSSWCMDVINAWAMAFSQLGTLLFANRKSKTDSSSLIAAVDKALPESSISNPSSHNQSTC